MDTLILADAVLFLSTLSLRRATCPLFFSCWLLAHFYPRSPCGERLGLSYFYIIKITISIHALLAESDLPVSASTDHAAYFYPRSPCGERQTRRDSRQQPAGISIHALLAESDAADISDKRKASISIHALLAESDQLYINRTAKAVVFLSTLSLRRAT